VDFLCARRRWTQGLGAECVGRVCRRKPLCVTGPTIALQGEEHSQSLPEQFRVIENFKFWKLCIRFLDSSNPDVCTADQLPPQVPVRHTTIRASKATTEGRRPVQGRSGVSESVISRAILKKKYQKISKIHVHRNAFFWITYVKKQAFFPSAV
jgi:hypothetical protein